MDYLRVPFGRTAGIVAWWVIGTEIGLGCLLATAGRNTVAGLVCLAFLASASAAYSSRLSLSRDSRCNCFGRTAAMPANSWVRITDPALLAVRNAVIATAAWQATNHADNWAGTVVPGVLIVLIVGLGLLASICVELYRLRLPEHPRRVEFAPRLGDLTALSWYHDGKPRPLDTPST